MKLFLLIIAIVSTLLATMDFSLGILAGGFDGWPISKVLQHVLFDPLIAFIAWRLYYNHGTPDVPR